MFYYFSIIAIPLLIETGGPILEKSMTGPFENIQQCLQYEQVIQNIPKMSPETIILESKCIAELKGKAV